MNIVIALIIGFIIGKIDFKNLLPTKSYKIRNMRNNLSNKEWVINSYKLLLEQEKDNDHYFKFECSRHFVGDSMAKHNTIIYNSRQRKINKRKKFIEGRIKLVDINYYIKFIGSLSEEEMIALKRDNKLNKILN